MTILELEDFKIIDKLFENYEAICDELLEEKIQSDCISFYRLSLERINILIHLGQKYSKFKQNIINIFEQIKQEYESNPKQYIKLIYDVIIIRYNNEEIGEIPIEYYDSVISILDESDDDNAISLKIYTIYRIAQYYEEKERNDEAIEKYDYIIKVYKKNKISDDLNFIFIQSLTNKAQLLHTQKKYIDSIFELENIINFEKESSKFKIDKIFARINKAVNLSMLGKSENAIKEYSSILDEFGTEKDAPIKLLVAKAHLNKAIELSETVDYLSEINEYENIIRLYENDENQDIKSIVVHAKFNIAVTLSENDEDKRAVEEYNKIIEMYSEESDSTIRKSVIKAKICRAYGISYIADIKKTIETFDEVIEEYENELDNEIRSLIFDTKKIRIEKLESSMDYKSTIEEYNKITNMYLKDDDLGIKIRVIKNMISIADKYFENKDIQNSKYVLNDVIQFYSNENNSEIIKLVTESKINKAILDFILENVEIAIQKLNELVDNHYSIEIRIISVILSKILTQENIDIIENNMESQINKEIDTKRISSQCLNCGNMLYEYNKEYAAKMFYFTYYFNCTEGVNLAYMIRRREVANASIFPSCDELLSEAISNGDNVAFINKALTYMENKEFDKAINIINQVDDENAFNWWIDYLDDDDIEKNIVLYLGIISNKLYLSNEMIKNIQNRLKISNLEDIAAELDKTMLKIE